MKAVERVINEKGHIILKCESSLFFGLFKPKVEYIATKERVPGFWNWSRLPDYTVVSDAMSFQLDRWNTIFDED